LDRRAWSWRGLLALSYLCPGEESEQGRERPALGGRQGPPGLATDEADLHADGERPVIGTARLVMAI
jgi:hypothetical protein